MWDEAVKICSDIYVPTNAFIGKEDFYTVTLLLTVRVTTWVFCIGWFASKEKG
jgi:hypothetical protein